MATTYTIPVDIEKYYTTVVDPKVRSETEKSGVAQQRRKYGHPMFKYVLEWNKLSLTNLNLLKIWVEERGSSIFWFVVPHTLIIPDENGDIVPKSMYCRIIDEELPEDQVDLDCYHYILTFESAEEPMTSCEDDVTIGYTTNQMNVGETQELTVEGGTATCDAYTWTTTYGTLTPIPGGVIITPPPTNPGCAYNPVITLSLYGVIKSTLEIAVNAYTGPEYDGAFTIGWFYESWPGPLYSATLLYYHCDGTYHKTGDCPCFMTLNQVCNQDKCCRPGAEYGCPIPDNETTTDIRNETQLLGGCCPAALL